MSTPFLSDYLPVVAATADVPVNPVADPGTSPEMIAFCFDAETQTLTIWDPINEERLTIAFSGGAAAAEDVSFDNAASGLAATNVQDAIDELDATIDGLGAGYTDEQAQDAVGAMVDTSLTYTDGIPLLQRSALTGAITASIGSNTTTLGSFTKAQLDTAVSDGNVLYVGDITQYTDEMARDAIGTALIAGSGIAITPNDGADTITIAAVFHGAQVYMTSDDTGVNATSGYTLSFDAARYDSSSYWSGGAPTKLTVPSGVTKVDVEARTRVQNVSNSVTCQLLIQHFDSSNNLIEIIGNSNPSPGTTRFVNAVGIGVPVTAGDYFIAQLTTTTDTSVDIISASFQTAMSIKKVE